MGSPLFTVCGLLYGDHPAYASRLCGTFRWLHKNKPSPDTCEFRLACNEIGEETRNIVRQFQGEGTCHVYSWANIHKYPAMRQLLDDPRAPIQSSYLMWFDDDSAIIQNPEPADWWSRIINVMANADLVGAIHTISWQGRQRAWVVQQPWYNGRDPRDRPKIRFVTGAWWCARTALLRRHGYPWAGLDHNGGDTMLGELFFQQNYRVENFRHGLAINAAIGGTVMNSAPRRGFSQQPLGVVDTAPVPEALLAAETPPVATLPPPVKRPYLMDL